MIGRPKKILNFDRFPNRATPVSRKNNQITIYGHTIYLLFSSEIFLIRLKLNLLIQNFQSLRVINPDHWTITWLYPPSIFSIYYIDFQNNLRSRHKNRAFPYAISRHDFFH